MKLQLKAEKIQVLYQYLNSNVFPLPATNVHLFHQAKAFWWGHMNWMWYFSSKGHCSLLPAADKMWLNPQTSLWNRRKGMSSFGYSQAPNKKKSWSPLLSTLTQFKEKPFNKCPHIAHQSSSSFSILYSCLLREQSNYMKSVFKTLKESWERCKSLTWPQTHRDLPVSRIPSAYPCFSFLHVLCSWC